MFNSSGSIILIAMMLNVCFSASISERFLATIFESPTTCAYKNNLHRCTFTFTCWLVGGTSHGGCGEDYNWLFTCCVPSSIPITGSLAGKGPTKFSQKRNSIRKQYGYSVGASSCGVPAIQLRKRIIGGNEAHFGEFPWQAHIRIAGARLRDIKVFLGEYDTQNTGNYIEPLPEEIHRVSKKILHPYFQFKITQPDRFDIALLKLSRKVHYRENILPICLPGQSDTFEKHIGVVAGWGKTDTTYGKTGTNVLQKAGVPILSDDECLDWHRRKNIHVELHKEMFCAGHSDGHMDACLGDSGGPLIVLHKGKWTLAGITSAGFGCAVDHQPGIYHKVAFTSKWISNIINRF
ncbi:hypothetical protein RUM43_012046 [Polyplax serrata]|uniref:Peptidase S1 domain-containing protein n=1 Tax=Polyplax serrata TaxID=468196 RepID=A0AAN8Q3M6_POLSC